jgi:hypothetical protein
LTCARIARPGLKALQLVRERQLQLDVPLFGSRSLVRERIG